VLIHVDATVKFDDFPPDGGLATHVFAEIVIVPKRALAASGRYRLEHTTYCDVPDDEPQQEAHRE